MAHPARQSAVDGRFADPVMDAHAVFRAVMAALAEPGTIHDLAPDIAPPAGLGPAVAAVLLTLSDSHTSVWLAGDPAAGRGLADWLAFQTGAPVTGERGEAVFAVFPESGGFDGLAGFALGTDDYPDRSATLIVAVDTLRDGPPLTLAGPGIRDKARLAPGPLPAGFVESWAENRALFPRGVDIIFAAGREIAALPRTTEIGEAEV